MGEFPIQYSYGLLGNTHQVGLRFVEEGLPAPATVHPGMTDQHEEILLSKDSNLRVWYLVLASGAGHHAGLALTERTV